MYNFNYFVRVEVTSYGSNHKFNGGYIGFIDHKLGFQVHKNVSYEQGMRLLRKLEKRFGQVALPICNQFNPGICHKEISGFLT